MLPHFHHHCRLAAVAPEEIRHEVASLQADDCRLPEDYIENVVCLTLDGQSFLGIEHQTRFGRADLDVSASVVARYDLHGDNASRCVICLAGV